MSTRLLLRGGVLLAAIAAAAAPVPAVWVERTYSRWLYPAVQRRLTTFSNLFPIALFDLLLLLGAVWGVWWLFHFGRAPRGARLRAGSAMVASVLTMAAATYLVFLVLWGGNYRRQPLKERVDYASERVTQERLVWLATESVRQLNDLYADAHRRAWPSMEQLVATLGPPFHRIARRLDSASPIVPARPKATILARYFRSAAIDGMIGPFFLETLVNPDVLPYERPFVVAHEWAHLAGYGDEGEASFVGWLACLEGDRAVQYSGWLHLGPYLWYALDERDRSGIVASLGAGPRRDLEAIDERIRRVRPLVSRYARQLYDRFLRANRVEAGVRSYDAVVDLALGVRLADFCLSGCLRKPPLVVFTGAAPAVSEKFARVPASIRH